MLNTRKPKHFLYRFSMTFEIDKILNKKVSQANDFIESPFMQEFTASELKIFEGAISQSVQEDYKLFEIEKNKKVKFTTSQLSKILNTSLSVISQESERIAKSLVTKHIHARSILENNQIEFVTIAIVPYAKYSNGVFELELNHKLIPYFIDIDRPYTQFYLHNISALKSAYAIKLYKLLYQYKNIKYRKFYLDELRAQFGISTNKYPRYSDFKKNALDLSVFQINERTDLNVDYDEVKFGRKVEYIEFRFNIKRNELIKSEQPEVIETKVVENDWSNLETLLGNKYNDVSDKTKLILHNLITTKGIVFVDCSINYAKKNAKTNFEKYLLDTLENNYAELDIQKLEIKQLSESEERKNKKAAAEEKNRQLELERANKSEIEHLYIKLEDSDKNKYLELAESLFNKHSAKLEKMNCGINDLVYSVFAISNGKFYNKGVEIYITQILKKSLNINDYLC